MRALLFIIRNTLLLPLLALTVAAAEPGTARHTLSLNGEWQFHRDGTNAEWKTVSVPSSFQSHEGTEFHGVGWYRKSIQPFTVPSGKRVLLQFQAAATEAEVWWNGERLGTHLGGWTPFRFDITAHLRGAPEGQGHELKVRLDEKVGHNTQGFLPIIAPHFGGIWQDVSLLVVPETFFDDLNCLAIGEPGSGDLRLELPLAGTQSTLTPNATLRCRLRGEQEWVNLVPAIQRNSDQLRITAHVPSARTWSPAEPNLYEIELTLPGVGGDQLVTRAAFRSIKAFGQQFRLNGQPLQIRGLLNWGYSPPQLEPNPGEAAWRSELEFARDRGFNLMKFCLWVPPQRYLELADEMGMLTWMEYPTWHPKLTAQFLEPLQREFEEFFCYDRNHPSILLRSLTCETGPSVELPVLQQLYETAHRMIPGALVEDDSSWIGWNRVHDFYDDHPYGNNHTWVKTLDELNEYVLAHGLKPLVLGEAIAADTWIDREPLLSRLGTDRPWWAPGVLDDMARWTERMRELNGPSGLAQLGPDSKHYGLLMRKFQAEAFRRKLPYGGYVISVIRDIPNASMGLLDYSGQPKWTERDWSWQKNTVCLLKTDADRRSFAAGEPLKAQILVSHFGSMPLAKASFVVELIRESETRQVLECLTVTNLTQNPGTLAAVADLDWRLPSVPTPTRVKVVARLLTDQGEIQNQWPLWIVPHTPDAPTQVQLHASVGTALADELFRGSPRWKGRKTRDVVVAARFDDDLARFLENGGKVLFLPDGQRQSLALSPHWFLRGAPFIPEHALTRRVPRDLFLELQPFDLAADVVPNLPCLEALTPILLLWDTHDQKTVKTHGILFETRVGRGHLLVSAARHSGASNAAGRWLLQMLLDHLRQDELPQRSLPAEVWAYQKARLRAEQIPLVDRAWTFKPDPRGDGLKQGWAAPNLASEADWKDIRIGAWWETQGYPALDGWAWYRLRVEIPRSWQGREVFLSFEGVDDIYELFINGKAAGKGGDLETRKDALNEKKSHNITRWVTPGSETVVAVRVYDWYGAGGIFRPVTLGTLPLNPALDFLK